MSAVLFTKESNLLAAVQAAVNENIVVLSSTREEGENEQKAYPAKCDGVIAIAARGFPRKGNG